MGDLPPDPSPQQSRPVARSHVLVAVLIVIVMAGLLGYGAYAAVTSPTRPAASVTDLAASPTPTESADQIFCEQSATFSAAYDAWAAKWGAKINAQLKLVDYRGAAGNLTGWHSAWAAVASDYSGSAAELRKMPAPDAMYDSIGILVDDREQLASIARQFSKGSFNLWNFNSYVWDTAQAEEEGSVSGMSFRFGFLKGLHSCA